ncbi:MAG: hypothetical protein JKY19_07385 [Alcanivoracaceae bacterium]|nr:hypothetical protein [Alcanivoracaceae bacterium]
MKILDEDIALLDNLKKSFCRYWFLWLVLLVTIVLDSVTTVVFMQDDGISFEANLLIRWLALTLGIIPGVVFGKALQLVAAMAFSALSLKHSRAILMLLTALNLFAIYYNLR